MFFVFEGSDGSGKSTQMALFAQWLRGRGLEVVVCRDPGSTALGEAIRQLLLNPAGAPIGRRSEMLLYMAARAQMVDEVIAPALAAGKAVVSDRYLLANLVYQGYGRGLDLEVIRSIGAVATSGCMPDLSIVLDLSAAAAAARLQRPLDRMEQESEAFREAVRTGYLELARQNPDGICVIDASRPVEAVQHDVRQAALAAIERTTGKSPL
ncbi:MAG TPA: dTMP kinase [Pirellulales bacterium]|jgi:dTMP kinase|nr:dTMP kinase [Pirellulales bacterium]